MYWWTFVVVLINFERYANGICRILKRIINQLLLYVNVLCALHMNHSSLPGVGILANFSLSSFNQDLAAKSEMASLPSYACTQLNSANEDSYFWSPGSRNLSLVL